MITNKLIVSSVVAALLGISGTAVLAKGGPGKGGEHYLPDPDYDFRTPSLRNVALTAPYGHGGAYNTLRAVVEHHLDPVNALYAYNDNRQAILPTHPILDGENYRAMDDPAIIGFIAERNELAPFTYSAEDVDRIMDFLNALTDPNTTDLRSDQDVVNGVPSKHPLDD